MSQKNTLFIGATHGDEPNGVNVLRRLAQRRQDFDWIIGNPKAFELGQRGFEGDLNRSAPGSRSASNYASRRAAEIVDLAKEYCYTIDIHGSSKDVGNFIILTKLTRENVKLACLFKIQNIVYWPAFSEELKSPLSEFFPCGLEIESGPKSDLNVQRELEDIVEDFLENKDKRATLDVTQEIKKKRVFEVYGSLKEDPEQNLEEFTKATVDGEAFYPLLINSYLQRNSIVCYKMKRLENILAHKQLR